MLNFLRRKNAHPPTNNTIITLELNDRQNIARQIAGALNKKLKDTTWQLNNNLAERVARVQAKGRIYRASVRNTPYLGNVQRDLSLTVFNKNSKVLLKRKSARTTNANYRGTIIRLLEAENNLRKAMGEPSLYGNVSLRKAKEEPSLYGNVTYRGKNVHPPLSFLPLPLPPTPRPRSALNKTMTSPRTPNKSKKPPNALRFTRNNRAAY
jgi:hypothetical protein